MRARTARFAMRAYPRAYRAVHEDEMLATLLDLEETGRAAGLVGVLDLVGHGALVRLGGPRRALGTLGTAAVLVVGALVAVILLQGSGPGQQFGGVPWLSQAVGQRFVAAQVTPVPARLPRPKTACPVSWLSASAGGGPAGGMESTVVITLRNDGPETCALTGTPSVVAYGPSGAVRVAATRPWPPPLWGGPSVDAAGIAAPHHSLFVELFFGDWCSAAGRRPPGGFPTYDDLSVSRPGGWSLNVPVRPFAIPPCFFVTSRFAAWRPPPIMPVLPFDRLFARLRLPHTFTPGSTLIYDVVLHNPTARAIPLTPCPAYEVAARSGRYQFTGWYLLNCRAKTAIPPHGAISFRMKLRVSRLATSRRLGISWQLNNPEVCPAWSGFGRCPLRTMGLVDAA